MDYSNQNAAMGQAAYANAQNMKATQAPENPSCFGAMRDASRKANDVALRVEHYVNRLIGSVPQPAQTDGQIRGVPSGLLNEAGDYAGSIDTSLYQINQALDRLEKSLP